MLTNVSIPQFQNTCCIIITPLPPEEELSKAAVQQSVCPMPLDEKMVFHSYGYYTTLTGSPMLEVQPNSQHGSIATRSGQNVHKTEKNMSPIS